MITKLRIDEAYDIETDRLKIALTAVLFAGTEREVMTCEPNSTNLTRAVLAGALRSLADKLEAHDA